MGNCFHRNSSSQRFLVYRYGHNPWKLFYQESAKVFPLLHLLLITPSYFPCAHCSHSRLCRLNKSSCVPKLIATQAIKQNVKKMLHKSLEQWNYKNHSPTTCTSTGVTQCQSQHRFKRKELYLEFISFSSLTWNHFIRKYYIKSVSFLSSSSFEAVL